MVVLNSLEKSSILYPGSNVRFLASLPISLLLLGLCSWLITIPPNIDIIKTLELAAILVVYIIYSAWVESRFRGGIAKRAMHAVVSDKNGKGISFQQALLRNILKLILLPFAPFSLYFMIKDFRRQAPHDKLAGTFVMWSPDAIKDRQPNENKGYEVEIR
jgi:uncharacterized RDD family membrane protein YckC